MINIYLYICITHIKENVHVFVIKKKTQQILRSILSLDKAEDKDQPFVNIVHEPVVKNVFKSIYVVSN